MTGAAAPDARTPDVRKRLAGGLLWSIEIGVILAGVLLTYVYWDDSLRADFLGSFLASSLALIVGIPIGIYINDLQRLASQADQRRAQQEAETAYGARIVGLVVHELKFNRDMLSRRRRASADKRSAGARRPPADGDDAGRGPIEEGDARMVLWSPLKIDLWRAVSDSGDIKYIQDPATLDAIVRAYYRIGITMEFERRHRDAVLQLQFQDQGRREGGRPAAVKGLLDILIQGDAIAIGTIDEALGRLSGSSPATPQAFNSLASPST